MGIDDIVGFVSFLFVKGSFTCGTASSTGKVGTIY
tara:strand:- start:135 stop:239 length:105 start_codon:yes stop_codon:yes gene_type:complete